MSRRKQFIRKYEQLILTGRADMFGLIRLINYLNRKQWNTLCRPGSTLILNSAFYLFSDIQTQFTETTCIWNGQWSVLDLTGGGGFYPPSGASHPQVCIDPRKIVKISKKNTLLTPPPSGFPTNRVLTMIKSLSKFFWFKHKQSARVMAGLDRSGSFVNPKFSIGLYNIYIAICNL